MTGRLRTSAAGLDLIKSFEGFRETAVRLPDGRWTIGYGHVRTAREGLVVREADAEELLQRDLLPAEDAVQSSVYAPLSQNQFDALVSLAFNISPGQFRESDVLRALNVGDFIGAANGFDAWRRARINGRLIVVDALVRRRTMEKAMFLEHPSGRPVAPTPLVTPEFDAGMSDAAARPTTENGSARKISPAPAPANDGRGDPDVAAAVKRMAEQAGRPAAVEHPQFVEDAVEAPTNDNLLTESFIGDDMSADPTPAARDERHPTDTIDEARRAVAERLAKILERTEKTIADSQAAQEASASRAAAAEAAAARPATRPEPVVLDEMPDFDAEPKQVVKVRRALIDDTETFDPGRDPDVLFSEAMRKEKAVNGRSNGFRLDARMSRLVPWIAILILAVLGLTAAMVELFWTPSPETVRGAMQGATTVLAVFGLMMIMSIYFMTTRQREEG